MTRPTRDANVHRLVLVMAALTAVLVSLFGPETASAAEAPPAQIRVGVHTPRAQVVVGTHGGIDAARRLESSLPTYDSVLTTGAATENSVAAVLGLVPENNYNDNAAGVGSWLAGSGSKLVLNGSPGVTGRFVAQGSSSVSNVTGVRAVLVRDPNLSVGYRIQTAFPTP